MDQKDAKNVLSDNIPQRSQRVNLAPQANMAEDSFSHAYLALRGGTDQIRAGKPWIDAQDVPEDSLHTDRGSRTAKAATKTRTLFAPTKADGPPNLCFLAALTCILTTKGRQSLRLGPR